MKNIFINSKESLGDSNDFKVQVNFTDAFFNSNEKEKLYVYPISFSMLNDFNNVNSKNNNMQILVYNGQTLTNTLNVSVQVGVYDVFQIQEAIQASILGALAQLGVNYTFSVQVNYLETFNKFDIRITETVGSFFLTYSLKFRFADDSLRDILGYDIGDYSGLPISNGESFLSIKPLNLISKFQINVKCNLVYNNYLSINNEIKSSNIFFSLTQDNIKNGVIVYENSGEMFLTECLPNFSDISFRLEDADGNLLENESPVLINLGFKKMKEDVEAKEFYKKNEMMLKEISELFKINILSKYTEK